LVRRLGPRCKRTSPVRVLEASLWLLAARVPPSRSEGRGSCDSEPETRAVRNLVARELFRGILTYHSYSQLILYPWGYTEQPVPDATDRAIMTKLAERMQQLIEGVHDLTYRPLQSSQLYGIPVVGDTTDWTYGEYAIPSFTIELRPDSPQAGGFILPPDQIQPTFKENLPAARELIDRLL
jgi:carboxypeptidase T